MTIAAATNFQPVAAPFSSGNFSTKVNVKREKITLGQLESFLFKAADIRKASAKSSIKSGDSGGSQGPGR